jgi:hypothetical protein
MHRHHRHRHHQFVDMTGKVEHDNGMDAFRQVVAVFVAALVLGLVIVCVAGGGLSHDWTTWSSSSLSVCD